MSLESDMIANDDRARLAALAVGYDKLDVLVMGQYTAEQYTPESDGEVCISIASLKWGIRPPRLSDKFVDVLRLEFDDVAVGDKDDPTAKNLTLHSARKVVKFIEEHREKKRLVVHCFAGVSRSRSMAAAICDYLGLPFSYTVLNNAVYDLVTEMFVELQGTFT